MENGTNKKMDVRENMDEITKILSVAELALEKALTAVNGARPTEVCCDSTEGALTGKPGIMSMIYEVGALGISVREKAEELAELL